MTRVSLLSAAGLLMLGTSPVLAADAMGAFDWSRFYVGATLGHGGGHDTYALDFPGGPLTLDITSSGFVGGAQAGFNLQLTPGLLVGLEADIQKTSIAGTLGLGLSPFSLSAGSQLDWFGTARARVGMVHGNLLVYGTGGFAFGRSTASYTIDLGGGPISDGLSTNKRGWTAGGGFEYALTNTISLKTEYLYVNLGATPLLSAGPFTLSESTQAHIVRAGVNVRLY